VSTRAACLLIAAGAIGAQPLAAQDPWPEWSTAWSPLRPVELGARRLPFGTALAERGLGLSPRIGLLWSGGNPAGLAQDVTESRSWLELARSDRGGAYRRPLDPDGIGTWTLRGLGWRPLGGGAVAGRIAFDSRRADVATGTDALYPYDPDPFVLVDTTSPGRTSVHAVLEGAAGWRFGPWHAALSLGVALHRDHSVDTRFSRVGRSSMPGAMLGFGREIAPLHMTIAVHGRWLGRHETHLLSTTPGGSRVFILSGFDDPQPLDVAPPGALLRRTNADGLAAGAAATGRVAGIVWSALFERAGWSSSHVNTVAVDSPPADRWEATVTRVAVQAHVPVISKFALRLGVGHSALGGDARRADLEGVVFRASDAALTLDGAVELVDPASLWDASVGIRGVRADLHREDFLAVVTSDVTSWLAEAVVTVGRRFGNVSAGVVLAGGLYTPAAAIPDPATLGPVYGTYIAPEQSLYAVSAAPLAAGFWLRYHFGQGITGYLRAAGERTAARGPLPPIPALPTGQRYQRVIALGIELTSPR
jgi:hypothetical protein